MGDDEQVSGQFAGSQENNDGALLDWNLPPNCYSFLQELEGDYELVEAEKRAMESGTITPLIKQELKLMIQSRRLSQGKEELTVGFTDPQSHQLTEAEEQRRARRKEQNKRAAKRFRQNKKYREMTLVEEISMLEGKNEGLREKVTELRRLKESLLVHINNHIITCPSFSTTILPESSTSPNIPPSASVCPGSLLQPSIGSASYLRASATYASSTATSAAGPVLLGESAPISSISSCGDPTYHSLSAIDSLLFGESSSKNSTSFHRTPTSHASSSTTSATDPLLLGESAPISSSAFHMVPTSPTSSAAICVIDPVLLGDCAPPPPFFPQLVPPASTPALPPIDGTTPLTSLTFLMP